MSDTSDTKEQIMDALMFGLSDSDLDYEVVETYTGHGALQAWIEVGGIKFTVSVDDRE